MHSAINAMRDALQAAIPHLAGDIERAATKALSEYRTSIADEDVLKQARSLYCDHDCDIEFDSGALISEADSGLWVAGWCWVSNGEKEED